MGNRASGLGCLGKGRPRTTGASPGARGSPCSPAAPQGPPPPGTSWACWGPWAVEVTEVTEVTETVVTEMVVTEAVEASPGPLDTLRSWLDGMEELQASQAPLAPDVTVAAAQLREQELLQRLLGERALQVERALQEAQSPAELRAQWDRLVQRTEARCGLLERLVPAAWSFREARGALLVQLTLGERPLTQLRQGQAEPRGGEGATGHLQDGCEGAVACSESLNRALEAGRRLLELLAEDEARLVREQLEQLQDLAQLTGDAVHAQRALPCGLSTASTEPSPPASLGARLEPAGAASECQGLKDQEQLRAQLAGLAERLEQLAQRAEAPGQVVAQAESVWEPHPPLGTAGPTELVEVGTGDQAQDGGCGAPAALWSETREEDTGLKATWGPAQLIWWDLGEPAAGEERLQPEGSWAQTLQALCPGGDSDAHLCGGPVRTAPQAAGGQALRDEGSWSCREQSHRDEDQCRPPAAPPIMDTRRRPGPGQPRASFPQRATGAHPGFVARQRLRQWLRHRRKLLQGPLQATSHSQPSHASRQDNVDSVLAPELPGSQRQPRSMAGVGGMDREELPDDAQRPAQGPGSLGEQPAQVSRSSLMVRVGGGWVALDEYLIKNDPGRAKGRTSQKIHERFLPWAVAPSRPAPKVTSSILRAPSCLLPGKTGLGACWRHRDPSSSRSRPRRGTRKGTPQDRLAQPTQD
ncbi:uncharacterized protein AAES06_019632 isoform 4-T4 [Glossophaga mutica]